MFVQSVVAAAATTASKQWHRRRRQMMMRMRRMSEWKQIRLTFIESAVFETKQILQNTLHCWLAFCCFGCWSTDAQKVVIGKECSFYWFFGVFVFVCGWWQQMINKKKKEQNWLWQLTGEVWSGNWDRGEIMRGN